MNKEDRLYLARVAGLINVKTDEGCYVTVDRPRGKNIVNAEYQGKLVRIHNDGSIGGPDWWKKKRFSEKQAQHFDIYLIKSAVRELRKIKQTLQRAKETTMANYEIGFGKEDNNV